jgi:hypothetical protein
MKKLPALAAVALGLLLGPVAACASDEAAEMWFSPSFLLDLDDDTYVELETAQRFRSAADGRADTYFARLWLNQYFASWGKVSGAAERRINDGAANETRTLQQLTTSHGILRTRLRFEQRFVDDADRTGYRLRPRLGVAIPVMGNKRFKFKSDAEAFFTLRSNNEGGDEGLTAVRSQIGFGYDVNKTVSVGLIYLRQQDFQDDGPDTIGHAPVFNLDIQL